VQLHPDNCMLTHRLGSEMQAFENTKKKNVDLHLILLGRNCTALEITLCPHLFKVRTT